MRTTIPTFLINFLLLTVSLLASPLNAETKAPPPGARDFAPRSLPRTTTPPPYQTEPFVHPGGLHTQADLDRMKAKVAARETPWIECWEQLIRDPLAQLDYRPSPRNNLGDSRQTASRDAHAAYLCFMRGYIAGDDRYTDHAIKICNDWSAAVNQVPTGTDIPGLSGIPIAEFAIVGELLRISPRWKPEDLERFKGMMTAYMYPVCHDFLTRHNGTCISNYWANWDICNIGALISMGVFCDRPDIYDEGVAYYLRGEGMGSIMNTVYQIHPDGLGQWQESGRDQQHAQLGVGMLAQACQIAWNQGLDLYGVADNRLLAGAEYVARSNLNHDVPYSFYNNCQPANNYWLSNNALNRIDGRPLWELIYNHYSVLLGIQTPNTAAMARLTRPEGGSKDHFGYGTLTFTLDAVASPYPPFAAPSRPTTLVAHSGVSRVELEWSGPTNDTAQGYEILRSTSANGPFQTIASWTANTSTHYTDTEVQDNTRYYYKVTAINQSGQSPASDYADATPLSAEALPTPWKCLDIGTTPFSGNAVFSRAGENSMVISGSGTGMGGREDSCTFASRTYTGNVTLTVRLVDVDWPEQRNSRVGLMIRENKDPKSKTAFISLGDIGARQTRFGVREQPGGNTRTQAGNDYTWTPVWYRLQLEGDTVTAFHSNDGATWFQIGSSKLILSGDFQLGFAVSSKSTKRPIKAIFDHITIVNGKTSD